MRAYENAKAELKQLRLLYDSAFYAFNQTEALLSLRSTTQGRKLLQQASVEVVRPILYRPKRSAQIRAQLRELIFIRLVSVLEAYLVDSVRDVFFISKEPFKEQLPLNITQAEVLSAISIAYLLSKIINKECRNLSSGGYSEILRYYKKRFGLDLASLGPGKSAMEEYHERRHLFVHRLGKPDLRYRRSYNFSANQLEVTENYLLKCFSDFETVIDAVNQHFVVWLPSIGTPNKGVSQASMTYTFVFPSAKPNNPDVIQESYTFWAGDELVSLADIATSKRYLNDRECEITISGDTYVLAAYDKAVRKGERALDFLVDRRRAYGFARSKKTISSDVLEKVRAALPTQPWPKGVHKQVAAALGLSNKAVADAIQVLISDGVFKHQIDGEIISG